MKVADKKAQRALRAHARRAHEAVLRELQVDVLNAEASLNAQKVAAKYHAEYIGV